MWNVGVIKVLEFVLEMCGLVGLWVGGNCFLYVFKI